MATLALADNGLDQTVEDDVTYVSSNRTQVTFASLPEIDDGSGDTVAVGTEIRFEATGGSPIEIKSADGRRVGMVPGRGQAVVVAESGAQESETDFWRFQVLVQVPAANQSISGTYAQAEIEALRDCLVNAGLMLAE